MAPRKKAPLELAGQKFSNWTVIERAADRKQPSGKLMPQWLCRCENCNKEYTLQQYSLTSGRSTQCKKCARKNLWASSPY